MEGAPVKNLSKGILEELEAISKKDENAKMTGFLQVLEIKEDHSKIVLSDGFCSAEYAIFKTARPKITSQNIKKYDIVQATLLFHKGRLLVVIDISAQYQDVGIEIGKSLPQEVFYSKGHENPAGDNRIPPRFYGGVSESHPVSNRGTNNPIVPEDDGPDDSDDYTPIALLTENSNSWMIKCRVVSKSELKKYGGTEGKAEGCLFDCVILDKTGRIQCGFFNEVAKKYYPLLEVGKVYEFQNGQVKKRGNFNKTNNELEISFNAKSLIMASKSEGGVPKSIYDFVKLKNIKEMSGNQFCDVIVVVKEIMPPGEFRNKKGETGAKQMLKVVDDSGFEIGITFFGNEHSEDIKQLRVGEAAIFTFMRVSEFGGGKELSASFSTKIITTLPETPMTREFIIWRNQNYSKLPGIRFEVLKEAREYKEMHVLTVAELKHVHELFDHNELEDYRVPFMIHAYIVNLPTNGDNSTIDKKGASYYYDKCPNEKCFKKATKDENNPEFSECGSCGHIRKPVIPRFIGSCRIGDSSDDIFVKFSSDFVGEALYGKTCKDLREMEELDKNAFVDYVHKQYKKEIFCRLTLKRETYMSEIRWTYNLVAVMPLSAKNCNSLTKNLLKTLNHLKTASEL
jgi:hypothetical protein